MYYLRFDKLQDAFDYLDGHILTSPYKEDKELQALCFQMAVQLWKSEHRPAVKQRALRKSISLFEDYVEHEGNHPTVHALFLDLLRANEAGPDDLRRSFTVAIELCPRSVELSSQYLHLLLTEYSDETDTIRETISSYTSLVNILGLGVDPALVKLIEQFELRFQQ